MNTYIRLPASSTLQSGASDSHHFLHTAPYAPRSASGKQPKKALLSWEDEGGSLAGPKPD
ncbi:MAG TPA: hypothetical protein PLN31_05460 [Azoarcus taiwanensis]|nr:hypothetical protein [Azoarcus taiwanensis]